MTHSQTVVGELVYARRGDRWYPAHIVRKQPNFAVIRWHDPKGNALNRSLAKYEELLIADPNRR